MIIYEQKANKYFKSLQKSLTDLLGEEYINNLCKAQEALGVMEYAEARNIADEKIEFYPRKRQQMNDTLIKKVGKRLVPEFVNDNDGASTESFRKAMHKGMAPITGTGCFRVGEDGRLYFIGKSEHYHASLGHGFGGYRLIDNARRLGVLNATHNNTRGYVTRLAEKKLVEIAAAGYETELDRVINLETGSLAVEAGVKMMLSRFYRLDSSFSQPKYAGKIPVFFVMADQKGKQEVNYHGTTIITQTFRGMWPDLYTAAEKNQMYKVVSVAINDIDDFRNKIEQYNSDKYKTAGFLHELILMNYGAICLTQEYIKEAYELCKKYDTPTLVDEIQTGMWYKEIMLFKKYGLTPDFAVIGKGFPGGEYPASKILTNAQMDSLNQFGALVTNGQEELASLAYLITIEFVMNNGELIEDIGEYLMQKLVDIAKSNESLQVNGRGHLIGLQFTSLKTAAEFAAALNSACIDASAQLYKASCPPVVLLKPPVITSLEGMRFVAGMIGEMLSAK